MSSYIVLMNHLIVCIFIPFLLTGATQNSIRVAQVSSENPLNLYIYNRNLLLCLFIYVCHVLQWMLRIPGATSYMGCIGKDKFGEEMKKNAQAAGVAVSS
jgi:hypothetical protein